MPIQLVSLSPFSVPKEYAEARRLPGKLHDAKGSDRLCLVFGTPEGMSSDHRLMLFADFEFISSLTSYFHDMFEAGLAESAGQTVADSASFALEMDHDDSDTEMDVSTLGDTQLCESLCSVSLRQMGSLLCRWK